MAMPFERDDIDAWLTEDPRVPPAVAAAPVLYPGLAAGDTAAVPWWNDACAANQDGFWLPHRADGAASFRVDRAASAFWRRVVVPADAADARPLPVMLPGTVPSVGTLKVVAGRKIRIYPRAGAGFDERLRQFRRAYNCAIEAFGETGRRPARYARDSVWQTDLRRGIRERVRAEVAERGEAFHSASCDEAVNAAFRTRRAVLRARARKEKAEFRFWSRKKVKQSFVVQRLARGFCEASFDAAEALPEEAFGKLTRIVHERGRWFLCAQMHVVTTPCSETQGLRAVAIDPGVRCFATAYSGDQCTQYGNNFMERRIFPLLLEIDRQISQLKRAKCGQWKRHHRKRLDRLVNRVADLVHDLHKRVAHDLVSRFDVILLPRFETRRMSERTARKVGSRTVRGMLGLAHYAFREHLAWMCLKYGKRLVQGKKAVVRPISPFLPTDIPHVVTGFYHGIPAIVNPHEAVKSDIEKPYRHPR